MKPTRGRRIVLLTRRFGGEVTATTTRLRAYVSALQGAGVEVTVLTRFPFVYPGRTPDPRCKRRVWLREQIDGAAVIRVRMPGQGILAALLDRALHLWARLRGGRGGALLSAEIIDLLYGLLAMPLLAILRPRAIVVEQGPAWLALPVWIFARLGTPVVLQVSDVKSLLMEQGRYGEVAPARIALNRRLENVVYRRATSIVTVTQAMQAHIAHRLGRAPAAIHLIPNGAEIDAIGSADPTRREHYKRELGLDGKFVVLYAGTFGPAHDLPTLLEAARELRDVPEIAFLLVGEGPLEWHVKQLADDWDLDNVSFRPGVPVAAMTPYLGAADAGVSIEIGGLRHTVRSKIYLYMAGRLPLIVTDDGGEARALLTKARSACLIPPGDAAAIVERILDLKRNPELAATLGNNGRGFVETYHDRGQLAQSFARVVMRAAQVAPWTELGVPDRNPGNAPAPDCTRHG